VRFGGRELSGRIASSTVPERDGLEHRRHLRPHRRDSASGSYALTVISIVTVVFFPPVLLYQGWSFYVFRARVS